MSQVISENIKGIQDSIGDRNCRLVAISKTKPASDIQAAYDAGLRDFGENKVQELAEKAEQLPQDIRWHMVGHLQRNKVKYIAPFIHLIHSVDSFKLLKEINKQAEKLGSTIQCLLQVHIATEDTKFGYSSEELFDLFESEELYQLNYVHITGLMGMATFTEDREQIRDEFKSLRDVFEELKKSVPESKTVTLQELSMGMSNDYDIAMEEGSTLIRLGSTIFGARNYQ